MQICLLEHWISDEELPALTAPCGTAEEVEAEFDDLVSSLRQKKDEAIAMLSHRPRTKRGIR